MNPKSCVKYEIHFRFRMVHNPDFYTWLEKNYFPSECNTERFSCWGHIIYTRLHSICIEA